MKEFRSEDNTLDYERGASPKSSPIGKDFLQRGGYCFSRRTNKQVASLPLTVHFRNQGV